MKAFPQTPHVESAPADLFESGHLWLLEAIDGPDLRFSVEESGLVRFGDREGVFCGPADVPPHYRHAVRRVRETLDRDALRAAVDDVAGVVFFGVVTSRRDVTYDWARTPSFLGVDVYAAESGAFRPPDAAEGIFETLGLHPANAVERERRARDFDPDSYEVPRSAWYDGPAAGVLVRNKRGGRALLPGPTAGGDPASEVVSATEVAEEYVTPAALERLAADLRDRGTSVTAETLSERAFEDVARRAHHRVRAARSVDYEAVRSAVAARTRSFPVDADREQSGPS